MANDVLHQSLRRQREYEEIVAVLRALRAADFDLGDPENADDERLLTEMYKEWRYRHARRQRCRRWRGAFFRWFAMFIAGAAVTLFGPEIHQWIKSHWLS